ncbi:MAG: hypothetical protein MUO97_05860 [Dehalococcoidia bacterium]|nr:hypothetical protein [Dehalococcoidia bacterium]
MAQTGVLTIMKRREDGSMAKLKYLCIPVGEWNIKDPGEAGELILDAEMHGNSGESRIHMDNMAITNDNQLMKLFADKRLGFRVDIFAQEKSIYAELDIFIRFDRQIQDTCIAKGWANGSTFEEAMESAISNALRDYNNPNSEYAPVRKLKNFKP